MLATARVDTRSAVLLRIPKSFPSGELDAVPCIPRRFDVKDERSIESKSPSMRFFMAAKSLLAAVIAFQAAAAHNIVMPAHGVECFHENLHRDDSMTVTFQVGDREFGSAGNLDIDFWVRIATNNPFNLSVPASTAWSSQKGNGRTREKALTRHYADP
jgi:hypothetical protein